MGFERDGVPSRVKGGALVGLGEAQNAASNFRQRRKSTDKQHETIKPQAGAFEVTNLWLLLANKTGVLILAMRRNSAPVLLPVPMCL